LHNDQSVRLLSPAESLALLGTARVGRVAGFGGTHPYIVPVRFTVSGDEILVSTSSDSPLATAPNGSFVAFEADGPPGSDDLWWSVLVTGVAATVTEVAASAELARVRSAWRADEHHVTFAIAVEAVSGHARRGFDVLEAYEASGTFDPWHAASA
jgi:nitroimidazol reductase NimA-like FMN-containing flavoprotein (pyridoxamine 5'-phosphate oxidase superfamily)